GIDLTPGAWYHKLISTINGRGFFFFSSRRRHTRFSRDWSSDVCSSDLSTYTSTCTLRLLLPTFTTRPTKSTMEPAGMGCLKSMRSEGTVTSALRQKRVAVMNDTSSSHARAVPPNSVPWWLVVGGNTALLMLVTDNSMRRWISSSRVVMATSSQRHRDCQPWRTPSAGHCLDSKSTNV